MRKKLLGLFFLLAVFAVPVYLFITGNSAKFYSLSQQKNAFPKIEAQMQGKFPGGRELRTMHMTLKYMIGDRYQDRVFVAVKGEALMYDMPAPNQKVVADNTQVMLALSEHLNKPGYLMLIPTASTVQQSKVPGTYIPMLYDQRQLIDDIYHDAAKQMTTIDVYPVLRDHKDAYIFYRTKDALTSTGGYYIYTVIAAKLGVRATGLEQYAIEHISYDYYGDLYTAAPYSQVKPDRISFYSDDSAKGSYMVTHIRADGKYRYFSLYPQYRSQFGGVEQILLAGDSPVVELVNAKLMSRGTQDKTLLIFGDAQTQSYLPFLASNFTKITLVRVDLIDRAQLAEMDFSEYGQVLYAYSVRTFASENHSYKLSVLLEQET